MCAAQLGFHQHPSIVHGNRGKMKNWDVVFRRAIYHSDPHTLYHQVLPNIKVVSIDDDDDPFALVPVTRDISPIMSPTLLGTLLEEAAREFAAFLFHETPRNHMFSAPVPWSILTTLLSHAAPAAVAGDTDQTGKFLDRLVQAQWGEDLMAADVQAMYFSIVQTSVSSKVRATRGNFMGTDMGIAPHTLLQTRQLSDGGVEHVVSLTPAHLQSIAKDLGPIIYRSLVLSLSSMSLGMLQSIKRWTVHGDEPVFPLATLEDDNDFAMVRGLMEDKQPTIDDETLLKELVDTLTEEGLVEPVVSAVNPGTVALTDTGRERLAMGVKLRTPQAFLMPREVDLSEMYMYELLINMEWGDSTCRVLTDKRALNVAKSSEYVVGTDKVWYVNGQQHRLGVICASCGTTCYVC